MIKTKILVVEDNEDVFVFILDQLEELGYEVKIARHGLEALEKVEQEHPDLIVLDVMMPKMDGFEVCRRLKSNGETKHIPILMLTAKGQDEDKATGLNLGADYYLAKPYTEILFEAAVKSLLRRPKPLPFSDYENHCTFSISCKPNSKIDIRVGGEVTLTATSKQLLDMNIDAYARRANENSIQDWRFTCKQLGKELYEKIFTAHPTLLANYSRALGEVKEEEMLHLHLESTRDFLRVPLEFLFEGLDINSDYLILNHPFTRRVTGVRTKRKLLSPSSFNQLFAQNKVLKILLIASNTKPPIPGVDEEIRALSGSLEELFAKRRISVRIKTIPTEEATYETVKKELQRCKYHIVHYAGHGTYNNSSPERSYLSFWEGRYLQGPIKDMSVTELRMLLRGSKTQFFYLSGCFGTKTGNSSQLLDDDFLGIADGLIHAGIPSVLGYRWPVSDSQAKEIALAFYRSLAQQGQLDTALLHARRELAAKNRDDITWLSPILIMQG